jgi:hypothetical protein
MNSTMDTTPLSPEAIEALARKRAGAKLGWFIHATVYAVVNAGLFLASSQGLGSRHWSLFPALGWGLGLFLHGVSVWVLGAGSTLRESMVQRERERLRQPPPPPSDHP